jgi:hypothetical protein
MNNLMLEIPVNPDGKPRVSGEYSPTPDNEILKATTIEDRDICSTNWGTQYTAWGSYYGHQFGKSR